MSSIVSTLSRAPDLLTAQLAGSAINRTSLALLRVQNQLATGHAINTPSDDPVRAATIAILDDRIERTSQRKRNLDSAVEQGVVQPVDTRLASRAWFGALNEVILHWLIRNDPERLEDAYDALRPLLMRSVGVKEPA